MEKRFDRKGAGAPTGPAYWRSLEELTQSEAFLERLHDEFPQHAAFLTSGIARREFLKLAAASLMLGGLNACTRQPKETIVPYVEQPENVVPGKPRFYATAATIGGYAQGILVESHEGRPTKIEGNDRHPDALGATTLFSQADLLDLYDPDRSRLVLREGRIATWKAFLDAIGEALAGVKGTRGAGLRILTPTVTSPTLAAQIEALLSAYPEARWHCHEPVDRGALFTGTRLAFGRPLETRYRLEAADVILSLDADFLAPGPGNLAYAKAFSRRRRAFGGNEMNRLYVVESTPSITGSIADHRFQARPSAFEGIAWALAAALGVVPEEGVEGPEWIGAVARDLTAHPGRGLIVAGPSLSPEVHALVHAMNDRLGNRGATLLHTPPVPASITAAPLSELVAEMRAGKVSLLAILGGNPVYDAPADLGFGEALSTVRMSVHLGLHTDETARRVHWHLPQAHYLETWSDARAFDGTATIRQPLIAPLYDGHGLHEVVSIFQGKPGRSDHDIVKETWRNLWKQAGKSTPFDLFWRTSLHEGVVADSGFAPIPPETLPIRRDFLATWKRHEPQEGIEIVFRPDPTIHDGRYTNNGWLQETPKPLTKLTWDNALLLAPATAASLGIENGAHLRVTFEGRSVEAPAWILPGQTEGCVTVHLGYGRRATGRVGTGTGFDAYALRTSAARWSGVGVKLEKTGRKSLLVSTQDHHAMAGRPIVRTATREHFEKHPEFAKHMAHDPDPSLTLYPPEHEYRGYAWGMAIDLSRCTGCSACTVACQAENNIPIVGKDQVANGREMHWIRIDRYYSGEIDDPATHHQPVLCQQCENAPCEPVCPVGATVHSAEGLNDMVYNRCVGTRYCANNCPYKVRRFNFLQYADRETESLKAMRNPNVTVRVRGVMEKCTYCVQRINAARIAAKKEGREIRDGEIVTACQAVCPSEAIVFGDINDPESRVSRWKAQPLDYSLLGELGTRPRTTYLAKITNPNPELRPSNAHEPERKKA